MSWTVIIPPIGPRSRSVWAGDGSPNGSGAAGGAFVAYSGFPEVADEYHWAYSGMSTGLVDPAGTTRVQVSVTIPLEGYAWAGAFLGYASAEAAVTFRLVRWARPRGAPANVAFHLAGQSNRQRLGTGQVFAPGAWYARVNMPHTYMAVGPLTIDGLDPTRNEEEFYIAGAFAEAWAGGAGLIAGGEGQIACNAGGAGPDGWEPARYTFTGT